VFVNKPKSGSGDVCDVSAGRIPLQIASKLSSNFDQYKMQIIP